MDSEKDHTIYTAEDIQKYHAGMLGPAEMHAMEKAALDDAFLAEAMEGYQYMQEKDWESHLKLLKENFSKRPASKLIALKPASRFTAWKVAAAILLLCSGVAIAYMLTTKQSLQNNTIGAIISKPDSVNTAVNERGAADTSVKTTATIIAKTKNNLAEKLRIPPTSKSPLADSSFVYRSGEADKKNTLQDAGGGYVEDSVKGSNEIVTSNAAPPSNESILEQSKMKMNKRVTNKVAGPDYFIKTGPAVTRKFMAQVIAKDGRPLPFSNIHITKDNIGTYADAKGNFSLLSADSLLNIEIKSVGYITGNFTLSSNMPQNKIVLAADELALNEKTLVIGKATAKAIPGKRRSPVLVADSAINTEPEDGWENYDTYITNNLSLTDDILQKKIHGEVGITFDVQSDGAPTNVKIDKSLCEECDDAAMRVIKEGPRWKLKKGFQATAKVKVKF